MPLKLQPNDAFNKSTTKMLLLAEIDQDFSCNATHLFKFVTDMENYSLWFPGVTHVASTNSLPQWGVGKSYEGALHLGRTLSKFNIRVKKVETPRVFITEEDLEPVLSQLTMTFTETANNQCLFSLKIHSRNSELDAAVLNAVRIDLHTRLRLAITNLKAMFGKHIFSVSSL